MKNILRRRPIRSNRNIVNDGYTKQRFHIGVMLLHLQRVPKEDDQINLPFRHLRLICRSPPSGPDRNFLTDNFVAFSTKVAVCPVPHKSYFFSVSILESVQSTISCFLLSCAINAIVFIFLLNPRFVCKKYRRKF